VPLPGEAVRLREAYQQDAEQAIGPIRDRYIADLQHLMDQATRDAKLEDAVAIKNELDAISAGITTSDKLPESASRLRKLYQADAARAVASLQERYIASLKSLMDQATRDAKLDAALVIKKELDAAALGLPYLKGEFERKLYGVTWTWNGAWHFSFQEDGSNPGIGFNQWKIVKPYTIEYSFGDGNHGTIIFERSMQRAAINEINPEGKKNPMTLYRIKDDK
jgi:hypothetical protein